MSKPQHMHPEDAAVLSWSQGGAPVVIHDGADTLARIAHDIDDEPGRGTMYRGTLEGAPWRVIVVR
jgi:hypothetical protein